MPSNDRYIYTIEKDSWGNSLLSIRDINMSRSLLETPSINFVYPQIPGILCYKIQVYDFVRILTRMPYLHEVPLYEDESFLVTSLAKLLASAAFQSEDFEFIYVSREFVCIMNNIYKKAKG